MKYIGILLVLAGLGGIISNEVLPGLLALAVGIIILFKFSKSKNHVTGKSNHITEAKVTAENGNITTTADPNHNVSRKKSISFNVAGVTKKNDVGKDIQKLIRALIEDELAFDEPYDGLTNKEILEDYYDERVYEYTDLCGTDEIYFEFEPDNPYDPNAIKVMHEYIDHIGYVPREYNKKVGKIIRNGNYDISWEIVGGKYKYVDELEDKVKIIKDNYGVRIKLSYEE